MKSNDYENGFIESILMVCSASVVAGFLKNNVRFDEVVTSTSK